ncbi:hypothetical protein [Brevundimonas intermedia]|uniref:hypothetical protein n=1 Tax=Brevundimonas intermedia TaxID=74315 RepID=UPI00320B0EE1
MFGLTIKNECTTAAAGLLADHQIELTKEALDPFIERFDRTVIVFDSEGARIFAKMLLADLDPSAEFLEDAEVREVEIAARRKSQSYTPAEADAARARYDALKGRVIPKGTQSAPAHKAWVTIREWEAAAQRGEWTHRWSVQFRLGTQMFAEAQRAVHPRQAANAMTRFVGDLRKSHHQVEVVAKLVEAI